MNVFVYSDNSNMREKSLLLIKIIFLGKENVLQSI